MNPGLWLVLLRGSKDYLNQHLKGSISIGSPLTACEAAAGLSAWHPGRLGDPESIKIDCLEGNFRNMCQRHAFHGEILP